jgi:hypothetical protein
MNMLMHLNIVLCPNMQERNEICILSQRGRKTQTKSGMAQLWPMPCVAGAGSEYSLAEEVV